MNTVLKVVPVHGAHQTSRLEAASIPMSAAREADARKRAAALLEESAKRWPEAFRR